jgi:hypothetical protein
MKIIICTIIALLTVHQPYISHAQSMGTGWPVKEGFVVTNYHVVEDGGAIWIVDQDDNILSATIELKDYANDIALLRVADPSKLPPAIPISAEQSNMGASVFTIGYPLAGTQGLGKRPKLTTGIISATTGIEDDPTNYQVSIPLQKGNSGGPLLNMKGEAVGIVTSKLNPLYAAKHFNDLPENLNFAVKSAYIHVLLASALASESIPSLPSGAASLESLATRVQSSVVRVYTGAKSISSPNDLLVDRGKFNVPRHSPKASNAVNIVAGLRELTTFDASELDSARVQAISETFQIPLARIKGFRWGRSMAPKGSATWGGHWYTVFFVNEEKLESHTIWLNREGLLIPNVEPR